MELKIKFSLILLVASDSKKFNSENKKIYSVTNSLLKKKVKFPRKIIPRKICHILPQFLVVGLFFTSFQFSTVLRVFETLDAN